MSKIKAVVRKNQTYYYEETKVVSGYKTLKSGKIKPVYKTVRTRVTDDAVAKAQYSRQIESLSAYTKSGELNKRALSNYIKSKGLSQSEANMLIVNAKDFRARGLNISTIGQIQWKTKQTQLGSLLANSDYTPEELAIEISIRYNVVVDENYILDVNHWKTTDSGSLTSTLILPNGTEVVFKVEYVGGKVVLTF